ncbi:MAG: UbiA family prenyltransferase [Holophagales bacterium]|nr:UbiA family prenyltransferase [Holophagales bacterium]
MSAVVSAAASAVPAAPAALAGPAPTGPGARPSAPRFWTAFRVTTRPYLMPVSGAAGLVGLAIAPPESLVTGALAFAALFLSYGLGQALTDVFQTDTDARSAPYRPLVRGLVGKRDVFAVSLAGLLGCGAALALANPWNLLLALLAVLGLLAYSPLKRRFWAGPPCNSAVVALLPAMGLLCGEPSPVRAFLSPLLPLAMASAFSSYAVFVLLGYLKDVEADRPTGYVTLPVRFGRRATVLVSLVHAFVAIASSSLLVARGGTADASLALLVLWSTGAAGLIASHALAWNVRRDADASPAIACSVVSFVALHLAEAALLRPALEFLVLPVLAFVVTALLARPCREQV